MFVGLIALFLSRDGFADGKANGDNPPVPGQPPSEPPGAQTPNGGDRPANATVIEVIDGDTLVVKISNHEERLRLIGIDTPESVATNRPNECFGKEASARLAQLLPTGTKVRVDRDIEPRDRYDRLLGYLYRTSDGLFVNHDMVASGHAEAVAYPPNVTMEPMLEQAEDRARGAKAGFWGSCGSADVPL